MKDSMQQLQGKIKERLKTDEEDIKHNWESSKDELIDVLQSWESKSNDFVKEFTALFDFVLRSTYTPIFALHMHPCREKCFVYRRRSGPPPS